jgi:hypothetical protein
MDLGIITRFFWSILQHAVDGVRSSWSYDTSAGVEVNVSPLAGEILTLGGDGVEIALHRGEERLNLVHAGVSGGVGLALPGEFVSGGGGTKSFPSAGFVVHMPWADDFASSRDFLGPSTALQLSGAFGHAGGSGTIMLLGLGPATVWLMRQAMRRLRAIVPLLGASPSGLGEAFKKSAALTKELFLLEATLGALLVEIQSPLAYRGAIVMTGTAFRVSNFWADVSASLVAEVGVIIPRVSPAAR